MVKFTKTDTPFITYNWLPTLADIIFDLSLSQYEGSGVRPLYLDDSEKVVYRSDDRMLDDITFDPKGVKPMTKIFVKTDLFPGFMKYINQLPPFILITGVSDGCLLYEIVGSVLDSPHIVAWIGCNIAYNHEKIIKVPIGLQEPDRCGHACGNICACPLMQYLVTQRKWDNRRPFYEKKSKLILTYCSDTHKERDMMLQTLRGKRFTESLDKLPFDEYLNELSQCKFVFCPPGNGIDTHRVCESLLVGAIPVIPTTKTAAYRRGHTGRMGHIDDLYELMGCLIIAEDASDIEEKMRLYQHDKNAHNYVLTATWSEKIRADIEFLSKKYLDL